MTNIEAATSDDIEALVGLQTRLFAEDAGRHDPFADITWPQRSGRDDFARLLDDGSSVVLVARTDDGELAGYLDGYAFAASPTRMPVRYAELRSIYVDVAHRRSGIARQLTERFVSWARQQGCVEAHVDHYAANHGAEVLYESVGFTPRSVSQFLPL